ncbi:DUF2892 domain-containing protein [Bacillus sp. 3255]|nr:MULTISPECIES: DUF2892 domain-containing protein [Bacillales]
MKCNVGDREQVLRIGIGSAIVLAGAYYKKWWGLIGIAPIVTGVTRYCPLNAALGISNCKELSK